MRYFTYRDSNGNTARWSLSGVSESDTHIRGIQETDGKFRTFRKDRVIELFSTKEEFQSSLLPEPGPESYRPKKKPKSPTGPEIAFTGFAAALRKDLETQASQAGLVVRKDVSVNLAFLCTGPNAGPKKLAKVSMMDVVLLDQEAFGWMLETGEIPV